MRASAALLPPMNPSMSTSPVFITGVQVVRPLPVRKFTTPAGSAAEKALAVRMCARPPI